MIAENGRMWEKACLYDRRFLIFSLIGMVLLCGAMKATGGAGFALIFLPLLFAFGKNRTEMLLYLLLATATLTVTNATIAPKEMIFSLSARALFLIVGVVMTLQLITQRASRYYMPVLSLLLYVGYMAIVSATGWCPMISYLKLVLFVIIFLALFSVGNATVQRRGVDPAKLRSVFLCMACFLIFGSMVLIPFPSISILRAERFLELTGRLPEGGLFTGITLHSQCLGPTIAMVSVVLLADLLFSIRRWDKLYLLLLACTPVLIYKTGSRTAMGTWLAGLFFVLLLFMHARGVGSKWKGRALSALFVCGILGGIVLFATPQMRQQVVSFVYKARGGIVEKQSRSFDRMISTRQGLIDSALANFRESPVIGNGFQVSRQFQGVEISSWKQLLSAPVEKGVWVTAVLEEGGVIGMLFFLAFLLVAFYGLLSRQVYIGASALFVFLITNLGEFTFFSVSYMGGLMWALIFTGIALDVQRIRQARARRFMPWSMPPLGSVPAAAPWAPSSAPMLQGGMR